MPGRMLFAKNQPQYTYTVFLLMNNVLVILNKILLYIYYNKLKVG